MTPNRAARLGSAGQAAALAAAAVAAFAPALHGGWLWDDPTEIALNPVLRNPHGLAQIWSGAVGPDYFPLKTSLQWVQWHLWGDAVAGYHATNLALHALAAILVWRLLARLGIRCAFWGGLIFAVHPLAVESVAWMTELKNTLSLPLVLGALIAFLEWDEGESGWPAYALSLGAFVLALLSKSSVVMFPFVLLLYAGWRRGRIGGRDLAAAAPFFAASAILGIVTLRFQETRVIAPLGGLAIGGWERLADAGWAVWFYLAKAVVPAGLLPIYPRWPLHPAMGWALPPWLALAAVFGWMWRRRTSWGRAGLFGLGSFVANLVPVLGIVPMAFLRVSWVSDHFAYLALVSAAGLAAAAVSPSWAAGGGRRQVAAAAMGIVAALFFLESRQYSRVFTSEETLWTTTVRRNPRAWLAHNNLGIIFARSGRLGQAIAEGEAAVRLEPDFPEARSNLGLTLTRAGRFDEAIGQLRAAVRLRPGLAGAHLNLGRALYLSGRPDEAVPEFAEALRLDPGSAEARGDLRAAHDILGTALARAGRFDEAVAEFQGAVAADPDNPGARRNLAAALQALGRDAEAAQELAAAERLERAP